MPPRPTRCLIGRALAIVSLIICSYSAQAAWSSQGQLASITNYFDQGYDYFEVDAYPGQVGQGGWNTGWTNTYSAGTFVTTNVISDVPLNGNGNYLHVSLSNVTGTAAIRRQYAATAINSIVGIDASTNLNTFDVTYIPQKIRFDVRLDSFTNWVTGSNTWSARTDNFFIHAASGAGTSPGASSAWVIFVQGGDSRIQDPFGPGNKWLFFDGNEIQNAIGSGTYVDSGMPFTFGTVYHFEVINDPRDKTYTVTVDNGTTTNKVGPLRWRSYGTTSEVGARTYLHFGGNLTDVNSVLDYSVDSIAIDHLAPTEFPPFISQLKPNARAPFLQLNGPFDTSGNGVPPLNFLPDYDTPEFWPAGRGITFVAQTAGGGSNDYSGGTYSMAGGLMATARTTIPTSGIGLVLNGVDVTGSLSITTPWGANYRKVAYNGLQPNTFYTGLISVTNSVGAVKQTRLKFNTLDEDFAKIIEAEDYNYGDGNINRAGGESASTVGGLFIDNPPASDWTNNTYINQSGGYVDRVGLSGADYSDTTLTNKNVANNVYRFGDPVGTTFAFDFRRAKYNTSGARDFQVSLIQPGEWLNYTRTFAAGTYKFYLRASSTRTGSAGISSVLLDYVTSDPTAPGQTTTNIGIFLVPYTGNAQVFTNTPLMDTNTSTAVTLTLPAGVHTLRLTALNAGNDLQLNYFMALPDTGSAPSVAVTSPANGGNFSSGATIPLTASASGGPISQVEYFNGTTSLGSSSSGPTYPVSWPSVPTGRYTITAKVTTSGGIIIKSAPVSITVGSPPAKVLFLRGGIAGTPGAVDGGNLGGGDGVKKSIFTNALGWVVTDMFATNLNAIGGMAASAGFDIIAVSVSIQASDANYQFRDVPVPLWNEEPSVLNGLAVAKDNAASVVYGASGGRGIFRLRRDAAGLAPSTGILPPTAGYSEGIYLLAPTLAAGNRTASLNENGVGILWSTNSGGPLPNPSPSDSLSCFVWYYPAGAELFNGVIAPAARYGWYNAVNEGQVSNPMNAIGTNFFLAGLKFTLSNPVFTGVQIYMYDSVVSGPNITIPFRAASYEVPADFSLWSSGSVNGPYTNDVSAVITKPDPKWNMFEATTTTGGTKYYRVRRN